MKRTIHFVNVIGNLTIFRKPIAALWVALASLFCVHASFGQAVILVDDDGVQCPQSLRTIQAAVETASAGSTILVCAGTYQGTVNVIGHGKDRLKIIAAGSQDEVILQGDHTQEDGFHLEDVTGALIQGFTVRDFGSMSTSRTVAGMGNNIRLLRANQNFVRHNRAARSDMMGIYLTTFIGTTPVRMFSKATDFRAPFSEAGF